MREAAIVAHHGGDLHAVLMVAATTTAKECVRVCKAQCSSVLMQRQSALCDERIALHAAVCCDVAIASASV